jgi:hypothetical protein
MTNINIIELDSSFPYEYINIDSTKVSTLNPIDGRNAKQILNLLEEGTMVELNEIQKELAVTALSIEDENELYLSDCIDALYSVNELSYFAQKAKSTFLPVSVSYIV